MFCNHVFHSQCLVEMCKTKRGSVLECPICRHHQPISSFTCRECSSRGMSTFWWI